MEKIKIATKEIFDMTPTDEAIWKDIRNKDITKKIRDFLWKHVHRIYRLGKFWDHIPGYKGRVECPICGKYNTFEHIVTDCDSVERVTIWEQATHLWRRQHHKDLPISEGAILGGGLANFKNTKENPDAAKNQLYRILMTKSTHLIWVLRCKRRITNEDNPWNHHTVEAIRNRWYEKINGQMQIDCLLTNQYLYENKALKMKKVYRTWAKCSTNKEDLHQEWCKRPGFLVGKTPRHPLGHPR